MTKSVEQPALHLQHNGEGDLYPAKIRENNVYFDNGKVAKFDRSSVFDIRDHIHKKGFIWKRATRFKVVIYLDGKGSCAKVLKDKELEDAWKQAEKTAGNLQHIPDSDETLLEPLTDQDRETAVKRMILKALAKAEQMKGWQFFVIMGLLVASIVINFIV